MKKLVLILATVLLTSVAQAWPPASASVTTNAIILVPARPIQSSRDWATTTAFAQGTVVKSTNNLFYFAAIGGTSSGTAPGHAPGDAVDGTITWRWVSERGKRRGLIIVNDSAVNVYIHTGGGAVTNKGIRLNAEGGTFFSGAEFQGAVSAVAISGTNNVTISER
ncbi:MAG: hypothetical protein IH951_11865 [Bacteroidetes bacterium]|nr:hypothetical protein [Bacteroidota bacterium]